MKRRNFIHQLGMGTVGATVLNHMPLHVLADSPISNALTANETDHVLVMIYLNGGNDGLNTVLPLDQYDNLAKARSNILIPENKALKIKGYEQTGLHPALSALHSYFEKGKATLIQNVGYANPNFSHFRATDIWMSASESNEILASGWAGRYLGYEYPNYPNGYPNDTAPSPLSISISSTPLAFQGLNTFMGVSIADPKNIFSMATGSAEPPPNTRAGRELLYLREIARQSDSYSQIVFQAFDKVKQQLEEYPANNKLADQLKTVAKLIAGGLKTRMYFVSLGGFDTHATQVLTTDTTQGTHATLLSLVSEAIHAFMKDLDFLGVGDRVATLTFSEFGRRIKSNDSFGTDHGSAIPMFLVSNKAQGGVVGNNPVIPSEVTTRDNLPAQIDFRSVYATLLRDWLCVPESELKGILFKDFPFLPLVNAADCEPNDRERLKRQKTSIQLVSNYPNPFNDFTTIEFTSSGGYVLIELYDMQGRLLYTVLDEPKPAGKYTQLLNTQQLPAGVYSLRFQNENHQANTSLVKR